MNVSKDDCRAWYDASDDGKSKIVVVCKVTEVGGSTATLVRAGPQGINPRMLMLKIQVEPYPGRFHPQIALDKELRYEEPAEKGAFTSVHVEGKDGDFTLEVEAPPE